MTSISKLRFLISVLGPNASFDISSLSPDQVSLLTQYGVFQDKKSMVNNNNNNNNVSKKVGAN